MPSFPFIYQGTSEILFSKDVFYITLLSNAFSPCTFPNVSVTHALSSIAASKATVGNKPVPGLVNGMDYVKLGDSDLVVSKICMGTVRSTNDYGCVYIITCVTYDTNILSLLDQ